MADKKPVPPVPPKEEIPQDIKNMLMDRDFERKQRKMEQDVYGPTSTPVAPVKKAKGGTASSRADGCAIRGKTRGTIVMCGGGMYKGKK